MISILVCGSRFPVGSSAMISSGSFSRLGQWPVVVVLLPKKENFPEKPQSPPQITQEFILHRFSLINTTKRLGKMRIKENNINISIIEYFNVKSIIVDRAQDKIIDNIPISILIFLKNDKIIRFEWNIPIFGKLSCQINN